MNQTSGKVSLVGAGPGDAGLLTVKGATLLKQAEVVVYDRLVSRAILEQIPPSALRINVGKNVGNHPVPQERINEILLEQAQQGRRVVRLKGGDPFVFGRGGEELELLAANDIPFEVVPGITAAVAVPAYAGIPVTHRDFCSSLHIITGHAKASNELTLDFPALVRLGGTLLFMMAVSTVEQIADGLMRAGMARSMPCAVVENGTRSCQRKFIATLDTIADTVREHAVQSPAVIVVGTVCTLSDRFDWFSELPLKNRRILVTQPQKRASTLAEQLGALGAEVTLYPCVETVPLPQTNWDLASATVLVFTSAVGVDAFFAQLTAQNLDARALAGKRLTCVGSQTATALQNYGLRADFVPAVFDGAHLAEEMIEQGFVTAADRLLLLRARNGTEELPAILTRHGIPFDDYALYETKPVVHADMVNPHDFDCVTFTSQSGVEGLTTALPQADFTGVCAVCIGQQTALAATSAGFTVQISEQATIASLTEKITTLFTRSSLSSEMKGESL